MSESFLNEFAQSLLLCRTGEGEVDRQRLRSTIGALYSTRRTVIFRYLVAMSRNPDEAEEVTQEAFLRLFDHCAAGRPVDNVLNWLLAVARNLMIDRIRSRRFERSRDDGFWTYIHRTFADLRPNAEDIVLLASRQDELRRVFSCLPALERNCLLLRSRGCQYREIGEKLDLSLWSAAHHTNRAIRILKQRIQELGDRRD